MISAESSKSAPQPVEISRLLYQSRLKQGSILLCSSPLFILITLFTLTLLIRGSKLSYDDNSWFWYDFGRIFVTLSLAYAFSLWESSKIIKITNLDNTAKTKISILILAIGAIVTPVIMFISHYFFDIFLYFLYPPSKTMHHGFFSQPDHLPKSFPEFEIQSLLLFCLVFFVYSLTIKLVSFWFFTRFHRRLRSA